MISWLFNWHDQHRRTAVLPFAVFCVFGGSQVVSVLRFHEPLVPEPGGYLIAATLLLASLVSLSLSLALWVRACIIIHIDRLGMSVTGVRMAVERAIRDMAPWNQPTSSAGNPRIVVPQSLYGRPRPVPPTPSGITHETVSSAIEQLERRWDKRDVGLDPEAPTGDLAS